jgi:hypothetical protein
MLKARSMPQAVSWLGVLVLFAFPSWITDGPGKATAAPAPEVTTTAPPPLVVGIAIDEVGMTLRDLRRSRDLVLALLDALPSGSLMTMACFSGEKRIVLPPTSDSGEVASALARFKPGRKGVALPDGLFDILESLGRQEARRRVLLLVSSGRVRKGDLRFEDPLNAATARGIPVFTLALGPGDGKLLRRVAKITGGEYMRLEVADAPMLAHAIGPGADSIANVAKEAMAEPTPSPAPKRPAGLLGAAAVLFLLGGLLMLIVAALLGRRLSAPARARSQTSPSGAQPWASPAEDPPRQEHTAPIEDDEALLETTLVVNAHPTLRALSGPGAGRNFPLSPSGTTSIGRSRRNDIVLPEEGASAQHCRIDREGDSYVLHDLGATNGTWVNGARSERAVLQHGDRLKVGETVFTVSLFGDRS